MTPKSLPLTKTARANVFNRCHLLPHQVIGSESISLPDRSMDARPNKELLIKEVQHAKDWQQFKCLLQTELIRLEQLID